MAPVEDQSAIAVMLQSAPDATLESTSSWASELADTLGQLEETRYLWALINSNGGFGGMITKDFRDRKRSTAEMQPQVYGMVSQIKRLRAFPVLLPPLPGAGQFDVELILKSDQPPEQMVEITNTIVREAQAAGVFMFVDTDLKYDLPQARVEIDRQRIADMGLDLAAIGQELGVLLGGGYVNRFNYFNRSYQVIPQLAESERASANALMDLKIRGPSGDLIPVSTFAKILPGTAPRSLDRFQQQSAVRINAGVFPGVTKEMGLTVLEGIAKKVLGENVPLDYAGESRQIRQEGSALAVTLGFALVLIYLVLSAQFHSFRDPLIVLIGSVPLAISGALVLTFLGWTTINIYSKSD